VFDGLKINSQENCPTLITQCFEQLTYELYLKLVHGQLKYFNETILKFVRENLSAVDVENIIAQVEFT